jgi:hypothetical protein
MSYHFQIAEMRKSNIEELGLTDVVTGLVVTMVCDHLGARQLKTTEVKLPDFTSTEGFTEFSSLTEAQVITWAENSLGTEFISEMYEKLKIQCEECIAPENAPVVILPPWVTQ